MIRPTLPSEIINRAVVGWWLQVTVLRVQQKKQQVEEAKRLSTGAASRDIPGERPTRGMGLCGDRK